MQIEALKLFCDVARFRSFSRAAAADHLTQSAASHVVLELERRLRVQLIDRSTRPLQLTDSGQIYYEGCKELTERYFALEASIMQSPAPLSATVQVAAIYSVGLGDMGSYIERFKQQCPSAQVQVSYLHPEHVYYQVQEGTADFGLVSFPRRSRDLTVLPWREEEMVVVCPPGHSFARLDSIRPSHLAGEKLVGFDKDLDIRREIDRFLRHRGVSVEFEPAFDNIENIKKAVEIGAGAALLPEPTIRREVQAGSLIARPLAGARFVRPLGIVYSRQHKPGPAALRFIELLRGGNTVNGDAVPGHRARKAKSTAR